MLFVELSITTIFKSASFDFPNAKDIPFFSTSFLASLIPAELVDIGKKCLKLKDNTILDNVNIRFNTFFRMAFKHAIKNNEPRNLYNLAFHYSNMIQEYIKENRVDMAKYCYDKFKFYANDVYKNAESNPALYFIVDTLTFELRKCQILIYQSNWSDEDQMALLKMILQLDKPPGYSKEGVDKGILGGNNGTRRVQIGLALFYLSVKRVDFASAIASLNKSSIVLFSVGFNIVIWNYN